MTSIPGIAQQTSFVWLFSKTRSKIS